jgi:hypothetical protein
VDTCLTKTLNFGFRDFAACPSSDPNSVTCMCTEVPQTQRLEDKFIERTSEFNGMTTKNNKDGR